jgi:hypothetical protein
VEIVTVLLAIDFIGKSCFTPFLDGYNAATIIFDKGFNFTDGVFDIISLV